MFDQAFNEDFPNTRDVIIANSVERIRGMTVEHGVFLPNWDNGTHDPLGFLQILHYSSGGKNPTIRRMLEERSQNPDTSYAIHKAAKALSDEIDAEVLRQAMGKTATSIIIDEFATLEESILNLGKENV
jgi:hypothetical protein